jgi:hypothetical protein
MANRYEFRQVDLSQDDWMAKLNGFGFDGFHVVASVGRDAGDGLIILEKEVSPPG